MSIASSAMDRLKSKLKAKDDKKVGDRAKLIEILLKAGATDRDLTDKETDQVTAICDDLDISYQELGKITSSIKNAIGLVQGVHVNSDSGEQLKLYTHLRDVAKAEYEALELAIRQAHNYWHARSNECTAARAGLREMQRRNPEYFDEAGNLKYPPRLPKVAHPCPVKDLYKQKRPNGWKPGKATAYTDPVYVAKAIEMLRELRG